MGVSRTGLLGKSLIIKTDRLFHIVVICKEWPRKKLFQTIVEILIEHFDVRIKKLSVLLEENVL